MGKATEGPVRQGTWKWSHVTEEQWCFTGFLQAAFGQVRFACVSQTTTTKLSCSGEERTVSAQCRSTTRIWNLWAKITEPSRHHTAGSFRNARLTAHKARGCLMHLLPPQEPYMHRFPWPRRKCFANQSMGPGMQWWAHLPCKVTTQKEAEKKRIGLPGLLGGIRGVCANTVSQKHPYCSKPSTVLEKRNVLLMTDI